MHSAGLERQQHAYSKATDRQVAVEWNRGVPAMYEAAAGDKATAQVRLEYGFVSEKNVKKHTDWLGVSV